MCIDLRIDTCIDIDMCIDMRVDMCIDMHVDLCIDTCMDIFTLYGNNIYLFIHSVASRHVFSEVVLGIFCFGIRDS